MSRALLIFQFGFLLIRLGLGQTTTAHGADAPEEKPLTVNDVLSDALTPPTRARDVVKIGQNIVLHNGDSAHNATVIFGNADIDGTVERDLVVLLGQINLGPHALVQHRLLSLASIVKAAPEAVVKREVLVLGGEIQAATNALIFAAEKFHAPEFDLSKSPRMREWAAQFPRLRVGMEWVRQGFFLARPLPPEMGWAWVVAGIFCFIHLLLAMMFPRPLQACVNALERRPIGSFFTGLLALMVCGPTIALLVISGFGIVVIPFLLCAVALGLVFGKIAVYRYAGQQVGMQLKSGWLQTPLTALLLGTLVIYFLYTVPIIGLLTWSVLTTLGLGNATVAVLGGMRRETENENRVPKTVSPTVLDASAWERVGFWRRWVAMLLDLALVLIIVFLLVSVLRIRHWLPPMILVGWFLYHVGMWSVTSTTVGGLVFRIKLVRENGRALGLTLALVRALASIFSTLALGIGFFWAGWSREKRAWHDLIAGTLVVKAPRGAAVI